MSLSVITISIPTTSSNSVRNADGGNQGTICARGNAMPDDGVLPTDNVYGMVFAANSNPPLTPPAGATRGKLLTANTWSISRGAAAPGGQDIPGASCATPPAPLPQNRLAVWIQYSDGNYRMAATIFLGACAADTACGSNP